MLFLIGFAHAFLTLEPDVEVLYKTTAPYSAANDREIAGTIPKSAFPGPRSPEARFSRTRIAACPGSRTRRNCSNDEDRGHRVEGQVPTSLIERAGAKAEIVALGRPAFDLANRAAVIAELEDARPDVVVNAAAYTAVDKAEAEEAEALRVNCDGAGHVAEAAARLRVPFLHLSTDYVFDGTLGRAYREDDPTAPTGAYGRSKLAGEKAVAERCDDWVVLRTAWVYSPFGANFVRTMLNSTKPATKLASSPISAAIRHRRSTSPTRSSRLPRSEGRPFAGA